jgi:hypothetical protein
VVDTTCIAEQPSNEAPFTTGREMNDHLFPDTKDNAAAMWRWTRKRGISAHSRNTTIVVPFLLARKGRARRLERAVSTSWHASVSPIA